MLAENVAAFLRLGQIDTSIRRRTWAVIAGSSCLTQLSPELSGRSATRPLRVRAVSKFRLDADSIINGVADPLFASEISLGCLHRHMSKEKLNLV